jgi:hypothetical protein
MSFTARDQLARRRRGVRFHEAKWRGDGGEIHCEGLGTVVEAGHTEICPGGVASARQFGHPCPIKASIALRIGSGKVSHARQRRAKSWSLSETLETAPDFAAPF